MVFTNPVDGIRDYYDRQLKPLVVESKNYNTQMKRSRQKRYYDEKVTC